MGSLRNHFKKTFLTGIFATVPLAVTAWVIWLVEDKTRFLSEELIGISVPFLGVLIALVIIYLLGLIVNSLIGRVVIRQIDRILSKLPGLKQLYATWKQIALTPGGAEGIFAKVMLIEDETGHQTIGFSSGQPIEGDPQTMCVFIPAAPNPTSGRLYFVRCDRCRPLDTSAEEAFKMILSGGNYIPPQIASATVKPRPVAAE